MGMCERPLPTLQKYSDPNSPETSWIKGIQPKKYWVHGVGWVGDVCADSPAPRRLLMLSKRHLPAVAAAAADPTDPMAASWHEQLTLGHLWNLLGRGN